MIYMAGAPPHQDLIDLKPNAPKEYRGDLNPIATNVPGIQISELLPNMARIMDKWTGIRSIVGAQRFARFVHVLQRPQGIYL